MLFHSLGPRDEHYPKRHYRRVEKRDFQQLTKHILGIAVMTLYSAQP
jgi:hypothetical protein